MSPALTPSGDVICQNGASRFTPSRDRLQLPEPSRPIYLFPDTRSQGNESFPSMFTTLIIKIGFHLRFRTTCGELHALSALSSLDMS